ncbi:hypothetical protein [Streptomyces sp. NBC_00439]|uniref:hypothetical protein n=1 Tax=Streptomyces sp. NBC_00439 TaxID=2903650 RepID=UPI00225B19A9|nr:hypothetical protein [Streptomyces sp. NBC_00439]MCX5106932.1 hypothetical protein [Streptomyces sp. NBC_00439]
MTTCAIVTVSACSNGDGSSAKPPSTPPPSSKPAPAASSASADPQEAEKAALLGVFNRFWEEQAKAYAKGDIKGTEFSKYAAAVALSSTEDDLKDLRSKGIVTTGAPGHDTTVDEVETDKKVPHAKLTDCLDSTDWKFQYRDSGKPVPMPTERLLRYETKVEAEKWGKQWKIIDVTPQQNPC